MSFAKRLKLLRKENNLTQNDLGEIMGISEQAISHYEKAKRSPDTDMIIKIASHFNISIDYFLGTANERCTADEITKKNKTKKITLQELFEIFTVYLDGEKLTQTDQENVISFLRLLRKRDK